MEPTQSGPDNRANPARTDLNRLLRDLNSHRWPGEAMRVARLLPPGQLMTLVRLEAAQYEHCQQQGGRIVLGVLLVTLLAICLLSGMGYTTAFFAIGPVCLALACFLSLYLPKRARNNVRELIADMQDPAFLGAALNLIALDGVGGTSSDPTVSMESAMIGAISQEAHPITAALSRMLRSVRADQNKLLTKEHRELLMALLTSPRPAVDLKCAILKAQEQIGDETALPVVESLRESRSHRVRTAAEECLPYLQQRIQQQQQARMLLRASDNSGLSAADGLLRPAAAADTAPEHLLRPQA
jgi:hypothetical protein